MPRDWDVLACGSFVLTPTWRVRPQVVEMVKNRLSQEDAQASGWLLDGYPRSAEQAEAIEEAGIRPDIFILINVCQPIFLTLLAEQMKPRQVVLHASRAATLQLQLLCITCIFLEPGSVMMVGSTGEGCMSQEALSVVLSCGGVARRCPIRSWWSG